MRLPRVLACYALALSVAATGGLRAEVHLTVGPLDQGAQHQTIQSAVDAVPTGGAERYVIDILPGVYTARVIVPSDKPKITLRGQDPLTTKITFYETANTPPNESSVHATAVVRGADFVAENLTFENSHGPGVQALAMYAKADRLVFNNCRFLGWQDTLRSEHGRHYFHNVYVEGSVDFVYGRGTAYFEDSTLFAKSAGYVTAQARESSGDTDGYVFKNTAVTGSANPGSVYLGRPWQKYSRTVFIDSKLGAVVNRAGWSAWSGNNNHLTAYYAEHNSTDLGGEPLDLSGRVAWSHQLTAAEAEAYSKENWLGGADGWSPVAFAIPALPGDYNADGAVDAADYTVWRDAADAADAGATLTNEAATPGVADAEDYAVWTHYFGRRLAGGAATAAAPEPAAAAGAVCCLTASLCRSRRRCVAKSCLLLSVNERGR
ncbi:pectinesterase family protein [Botrimarina sp.]|uniref:pectinesterase family protein n=1 Tax=Botrimarina sp. TaxID=2795802 RepID=UPI0032EC535D